MSNATWIDDTQEHSEYDEARIQAIAKKITAIEHAEENANYRRMFDIENDRYYDPSEDCECSYCVQRDHGCDDLGKDECCSLCENPTELTECETRKEMEKLEAAKRAESDLELEMLHDKLAAIGARMMRPYEHWNEDERYMEYMENRSEY